MLLISEIVLFLLGISPRLLLEYLITAVIFFKVTASELKAESEQRKNAEREMNMFEEMTLTKPKLKKRRKRVLFSFIFYPFTFYPFSFSPFSFSLISAVDFKKSQTF